MNLTELASKYGTDKLDHGYIPFYEQHLPKEPKRVLEIGVKEGRSLAMWAEYFPNAEIHGLDLFSEIGEAEARANIIELRYRVYKPLQINVYEDNIILHTGNQCDWRMLEFLRDYNFDVIIDDGSHNSRDQMMTFFGLFNGKHYFIEDLHCNNEEFYSQGLPRDFSASFLFSDIKVASYNTVFENVVQFNDGEINEPHKIVCIKI